MGVKGKVRGTVRGREAELCTSEWSEWEWVHQVGGGGTYAYWVCFMVSAALSCAVSEFGGASGLPWSGADRCLW